jgi:hypothetical protein
VTIEDLGLVRHGRAGKRQVGVRVEHPDSAVGARTPAVLTEFTGMDLMLNRRGLVGADAALTAEIRTQQNHARLAAHRSGTEGQRP